MREAQATARALGLEAVTSAIRRPEDIAPAFDALKGNVEALYVCGDPLAVYESGSHQHLGVRSAAAHDVRGSGIR